MHSNNKVAREESSAEEEHCQSRREGWAAITIRFFSRRRNGGALGIVEEKIAIRNRILEGAARESTLSPFRKPTPAVERREAVV